MANPRGLETTTHLVAHLLREIESGIRHVLEPITRGSQPTRPESGGNHAHEILVILAGLEIPEEDPIAVAWMRLAGERNEYGLAARAHRPALEAPRSLDDEFRGFFDDFEAILDRALDRYEANHVQVLALLDELLARDPFTAADSIFLRNHVPQNYVTLNYFFSKLTTPERLESLAAAGFFADPPGAERSEDGRTIQFPPWPQSRYLARVAAHDSETAVDVALSIPDTDNIRIHADIAEIALNVPPKESLPLVPRLMGWIDSPYKLLLPHELGALVGHLATGGESEAALRLAGALLAFRERAPSAQPQSSMESAFAESEPKVGDHEFREILTDQIPVLIATAGQPAITMLCDLLDVAIRESSTEAMVESSDDLSWIWRPSIEPHEQNHDFGVKEALTDAIRTGMEHLAQQPGADVPALVAMLEERDWSVFRRLALHLMRVAGALLPGEVGERLTDQSLFEDAAAFREYMLLARDHFSAISADEQDIVLGYIDAGPDREAYRQSCEQLAETSPTDTEVDAHVQRWQRDRLAVLVDVLPEHWRTRYEVLVADHGPAEHPGLLSFRTSQWGFQTPATEDDLGSMDIPDLVAYLGAWEPSDGPFGPSRDGLGNTLAAAVGKDPARYASAAASFIGLRPEYVTGALHAFQEAVKTDATIAWDGVLDLCGWAIGERYSAITSTGPVVAADDGWAWIGQEVMRLLATAFESSSSPIPLELRDMAWALIARVAEDPQPTPDDEQRFGPPTTSPVDLALNSVRSVAVATAIQYGLWTRRALPDSGLGELIGLLDAHLDPTVDPSVAVRSVYGRWFPYLVALVPEWATEAAPRIFPADSGQEPYWGAAWDAYLGFPNVDLRCVSILSVQYLLAVNRVDPGGTDRTQEARDNRLGEHLAILYLHDQIHLEDDGLLDQFYDRASVAVRRQVLGFIGRSLDNPAFRFDAGTQARLAALWASRIAAVRGGQPPDELTAFGWWFSSSRVPQLWALEQLAEELRLVGRVDNDYSLVDKLADISSEFARHTLTCLQLMIEGDRDGWRLTAWDAAARRILSAGLSSDEENVRRQARELIGRASARGQTGWRDLLGG